MHGCRFIWRLILWLMNVNMGGLYIRVVNYCLVNVAPGGE